MNTLYLINGQIQIKSINISFSKIYCRDFYYAFSYSSGSNSSFSTFTNSTSGSTINYYKLRHTDSAEVFNIINCNVLNNKNASILQALYDTSSSCYIKNSSFINNILNDGCYYFDGTITLDGCFIDNNSPRTTWSVAFTNRNRNQFTHDFSLLCLDKKTKNEETNSVKIYNILSRNRRR